MFCIFDSIADAFAFERKELDGYSCGPELGSADEGTGAVVLASSGAAQRIRLRTNAISFSSAESFMLCNRAIALPCWRHASARAWTSSAFCFPLSDSTPARNTLAIALIAAARIAVCSCWRTCSASSLHCNTRSTCIFNSFSRLSASPATLFARSSSALCSQRNCAWMESSWFRRKAGMFSTSINSWACEVAMWHNGCWMMHERQNEWMHFPQNNISGRPGCCAHSRWAAILIEQNESEGNWSRFKYDFKNEKPFTGY